MLDIITGHVNELFNREEQLSKDRMEICKACPLLKQTVTGPVCNSNLYLNIETGETSEAWKAGWHNGCGCRLNAKTRVEDAHCPLSKW